jgi:hypothetical protein
VRVAVTNLTDRNLTLTSYAPVGGPLTQAVLTLSHKNEPANYAKTPKVRTVCVRGRVKNASICGFAALFAAKLCLAVMRPNLFAALPPFYGPMSGGTAAESFLDAPEKHRFCHKRRASVAVGSQRFRKIDGHSPVLTQSF